MQLSVTGLLNREQQTTINQKLEEINQNSGIKYVIHIEGLLEHDILDRAAFIYEKLQLEQSENKITALLLISVASRKFTFLTGKGISEQASHKLSEEIHTVLTEKLKLEDYFGAITDSIHRISHLKLG